MKILLTGATGYIGKRLLPVLIQNGHRVVCCVRDKTRFSIHPQHQAAVEVIEVDFLDKKTLPAIPQDIDAAYYLIHSMSANTANFDHLEANAALNFKEYIQTTAVKQVVFLSGIVNEEKLSKHLASRKSVETILASGNYGFTALRAGIILGSGSASFEIMRDLVEKLPVMIAPKWLHTKSQPIAIRNVIQFLSGVLLNPLTYNQSYDIGGPDVMTYKEMLLQFARIRGLHRFILTVPVMSPQLSSYWLYFVTSTSYPLAVNLVKSMNVEVVAQPNNLADLLGIKLLSFEEAIRSAFKRIEQNEIISSWKDSLVSGILNTPLLHYVKVPTNGCYIDSRVVKIDNPDGVMQNIWSLGGDKGWYYGNWLWQIRGFLDKLFGGVGLRRGRTHPTHIHNGDALDFWRVLLADKAEKRLLLFAEMKLPGEAWLEFRIQPDNTLHQTATFRPKGILGRLYWYAVLPLHFFVFNGMINNLAKTSH